VLRGILGAFYALGAGAVFVGIAAGLLFGRETGGAAFLVCALLGLIGVCGIGTMNERARRKRPPWEAGDGT